jgi:hypothetical protein
MATTGATGGEIATSRRGVRPTGRRLTTENKQAIKTSREPYTDEPGDPTASGR